jgi:hypothetical protein
VGNRGRLLCILLAIGMIATVSLPAAGADPAGVASAAKKKCKGKTGKKKKRCLKKNKKKQPLKDSGLSMNPVNIEYGSVSIGQTSEPGILTVTNTGNYSSGHLDLAFGGPHQSSFPMIGDTCSGAQLPPGGTCTITTRFVPNSLGSKSVTVSVVGTQGGTDVSLLRGTGTL